VQHPLVILTETLDADPAAWLAERAALEHATTESRRFDELAPNCEGLLVRTYTRVDEPLLRRLPQLRVIGRAGVGLDQIDVSACRARGVEVVHTPDANTQAVVEYVVCLLADALRPRLVLPGAISVERWHELRREVAATRQMNECTLGILGTGRIGRRVAEVAAAIGFRVLRNDLRTDPSLSTLPGESADPETLFAESDVVTIHIDGRTSNRGFVDARLLTLLKPDAVLLNTSRGMVVDTSSLVDHLAAHPASQALLDVHEPEPIPGDHPLLALPNAHLMPHLASRTRTATLNMSWVVRDVWRVLCGESPEHPAPRESR
jgi:phosphoglycerate dehydrogenase-like enzyme